MRPLPKAVNYAKYFALVGLKLDSTASEAPGAHLGVDTHTEELPPSAMPGGGRGGGRCRGGAPTTQLMVTDVAAGSPVESAGLKAGDQILQADGAAATAVLLNNALTAKKAGDKLKLRISRGGAEQEFEVTLVGNVKKTYSLSAMAGVTTAQSTILNHWLRVAQ